ncbi:protease [Segetibacter sp. 3557_3]|uniref:M57 family metalloprotease n=1 Tax=Segetibacter sp. 3557_3 TaxID=2547429 RepID=UPI0010591A3B|nr:M57 family metalloprotease [Segetibacter sp. 3557_3]TDH28599.1 protease [Segetibacter sp. 3557_3]
MRISTPISSAVLGLMVAATFGSCKKAESVSANESLLRQDEKALVSAAGFNSNWAEKTSSGSYLIEGDILLTRAQLQEMAGATPSHNFIVANEEHYRTYNIVTAPATGSRTITVRLTDGFPAYYSTGLDQSIARYNSYNLRIRLQRVSTGGDIVVTASNLGTSGGGCILGQASGFPTSDGNPSKGFTLSNSSCATSYISDANKADEVIAHEIGHCIGFRHTDYKTRASCGPGGGESAGSIGAVHIAGTPTNVSGSNNSWMMACTNGNPGFTTADQTALREVY